MPLPLKGLTFLDPGEQPHLWIVLTDGMDYESLTYKRKEYALVVNVTTSRFDKSCVLKAGDHPFIKRDSYVYYAKAELYSARRLLESFMNRKLRRMAKFDLKDARQRAVFERIRRGFLKSVQSAPELADFLKKASER